MKCKLLVAEDELIERKVLCKTLQKYLGDLIVLYEARNGREALELFAREAPQVVILDIEMPGYTGLEVARKIRETDKNCGILFLTGYDKFAYAKQAIAVRALDYLLKPYKEQELVFAVEDAIRQVSARSPPLPPRAVRGQGRGRELPALPKNRTNHQRSVRDIMKKARKNRDRAALNSPLIRRPIQKCFWLFLLPTFAAFCIGFLYPFCKGFFLSFCDFKTTKNWTWVGIKNYIAAFQDKSFGHAFWYTALFAVVSLVLINVIAFAIAYALTRGIKGSNLFRTVFFMPNLIGGIVLGYIWSMIFNGILIKYSTSVVLESKYGFWGLIILMCWQQIGYMMIIYVAGLQSVPEDMLEAARIDGANGWQTLWKITIPNVMPSITICTFLTLTNSFKLYDQNLALTAGRPFIQQGGEVIKTTEMLALNIVNSFYASARSRGVGQAKAVIFFVLVAVLSILQLRSTREKEVQQ